MATHDSRADFSAQRVAVCGDLIADRYVYASPQRLSREAPVMVLRYEHEQLGAGGAANVARNVAALGSEVTAFGAIGTDESGAGVRAALSAARVDTRGLRESSAWRTPTKTRVLAAEARRFPHQVLRIDREPDGPLEPELRADVITRLAAARDASDALVVSDYAYGMVGEELAAEARAWATAGRVVVLDPRNCIDGFDGITAMTPNIGELARFQALDQARLDKVSELRAAALDLLDRVGCKWLLVTRGNLGMALFGEGIGAQGLAVAAAGKREVTDVSGAGDTSAGVFALALTAGHDAPEAMRLANLAAGVVVMEIGTAVCPLERLLELQRDPESPELTELGASAR